MRFSVCHSFLLVIPLCLFPTLFSESGLHMTGTDHENAISTWPNTLPHNPAFPKHENSFHRWHLSSNLPFYTSYVLFLRESQRRYTCQIGVLTGTLESESLGNPRNADSFDRSYPRAYPQLLRPDFPPGGSCRVTSRHLHAPRLSWQSPSSSSLFRRDLHDWSILHVAKALINKFIIISDANALRSYGTRCKFWCATLFSSSVYTDSLCSYKIPGR